MKSKLCASLEEAIKKAGFRDGITISFHHHLRNGDYVLNKVLDEVARLGFRDITINASSLFECHAPLITHIKNHVVTGLETGYMSATLGRAICSGILDKPVIFRSHGTRPSDIMTGKSKIDIAFIAAPTSDFMGNCSGKYGPSACGSLGYAIADAIKADKVVVITDNLVNYPLNDASISEEHVDFVVKLDKIGDPSGIISGTTRMPRDPVALRIASLTAKAILASEAMKDGFSFQTGAGGASLAAAACIKDIMLARKIKGSFALGGVTGYIVDMLESGCFESIQDVQCFDLRAVESLRDNPRHFEISASRYASPTAKSTAASNLDVVILGATQIDLNFNVNVHTDSDGIIMGGSGGHTDVAEEAGLTVITAPLSRARLSSVVEKVLTISTPGAGVDMLVTQSGIAVNPRRPELKQALKAAHLPVKDIEELYSESMKLNGMPDEFSRENMSNEKVVAKVMGRRGEIQDLIYLREVR